MGLRELKKEQTRRLITETASRLFADRGFDHVTVAEVAREAQVAEATVFNYFPTKEDLFYSGLEAFGARLVEAVAARDAGEPVLVSFRRFILDAEGLPTMIETGDAGALEQMRTVSRVIAASPALQAREVQALSHIADTLAAQLATEAGRPDGDIEVKVVAAALMGVHRALIEYARRRVLDDDEPTRLATDLREYGESAFALLEAGLSESFRKPHEGPRGIRT